MVNVENKLLLQMIQKLGLAEHEQVVPKSTELLRLLQIKSAGGVVSLGDYAKAIICIDLAASLLGLPCDNEMTLKLSGLKKSAYVNNRRTIEKLLDINQLIGINEVCIQLGLHQVQKEATALLNSYKTFVGAGSTEIDFTHPQYATMSVFQACKRLKVKPPKAKLISLSHLKPTQWTLLEKNWEKFLANATDVSATAATKLKQNKTVEAVEQTEEPLDKRSNGLKHSSPEKIEPYGNWKKRMLEKAYRELKSLQGR
ncbi:origin recognition complex subunit 6 [Topomyia yanbarensis]|uniref:origin recognition complex subunit 6 n=1 Tax=Topomyia yanbarensis TaxID=2498891 RepID=UPI00273B0188|nr:origin recognition complex subunit 6 [Topomyia yanbarensis]